MTTVLCQYTGVLFEPQQPRQRIHPQIQKLLNEATNLRVYRIINSRLEVARAAGVTDIDTFVAYAKSGKAEDLE